jgi:hypothetical protein
MSVYSRTYAKIDVYEVGPLKKFTNWQASPRLGAKTQECENGSLELAVANAATTSGCPR